jgi:hypothetical protein
VTTLGDFVKNAIFTTTSPKASLGVVYVESGALVQQSIDDFKATWSNWDKFLVRAWTPGFEPPTPTMTKSNQYRLIMVSLSSKGGDVGVVIEPPTEGAKKRVP